MDRLTQLREYMEKERLDAFYIAKPANVRCISGFPFYHKGESVFYH